MFIQRLLLFIIKATSVYIMSKERRVALQRVKLFFVVVTCFWGK